MEALVASLESSSDGVSVVIYSINNSSSLTRVF